MAPANSYPRAAVALTVALVIVAGTVVSVSAGTRRGGVVEEQVYAWSEDPTTTETSEWQNIPALKQSLRCENDEDVAVTLTVELAAASSPVEVRIAVDEPIVRCPDECPGYDARLRPRAVTLPGAGAHSFTFVGRTSDTGPRFYAQWRLDPTAPGEPSATMERASLRVISGSPPAGNALTC